VIRVEGLDHGILSVPELSIPPGLCVVTGRNGSGKTTLLRLLAGICVPGKGSVTVDGRDPASLERGFVHEFPGRNCLFSIVYQEVSSPLWFRHAPCEEVERSVSRAARSVEIEGLLSRGVRNLSGGEQVLCALATAVVQNPSLLVLDEWDSHLDCRTAARVEECIRAMGIPHVVWCTQDMDIAASADYVVFLEKGQVTYSGTPQTVFPALKETCWYPPSWRWKEWNSSLTASS
jgi:energy-coupling factor transport system ATP-binding protein